MTIELTGTLKVINAEFKVNDNLSKKEIVVTIDENSEYPQDIICQAINKKIALLDNVQMGQKITVKCNLQGKATKDNRYFNNLTIWDVK